MFTRSLLGIAFAVLLSTAPAFAQTIVAQIDDPVVISLPNGFSPDGITIAQDGTMYAASFYDGKIVRGSVNGAELTGVLVDGVADRPGWGMDLDDTEQHLFVAGGFSGVARVYSAETGVFEAEIPLTRVAL